MADYFVDVSAAGGGDGSPGTPWNSITQVNTALSSGDTVSFNKGDTFTGLVVADDAGVTYQAYGTGADPIIDGNGAGTPFTASATVTIQDIEINGYTAEAMRLAASDCVVDNVTIRNQTTGNAGKCIKVNGAGVSGCLIKNSNIYQGENAPGVDFSNSGGSNTIENCTLYGVSGRDPTSQNHAAIYTLFSDSNTVRDCTIDTWGRASNAVYSIYWRHHDAGVDAGVIDGLTIISPEATGYFSGGTSALRLSITNMHVTSGEQSGILVNAGAFIDMRDCSFKGCLQHGIFVDGCNSLITNTLIEDNIQRGVSVRANAVARLYNCTVRNNGWDASPTRWQGVTSDGASATLYMEGGLVTGNATDGVNGNNGATLTIIGVEVSFSGNPENDGAQGDGVSVHDTCVLNMSGCLLHDNNETGTANVATSSGTIDNCTFYNNGNAAVGAEHGDIAIYDTATFDVNNCVCIGSDLALYAPSANYTGDNNVFYNSAKTDIFVISGGSRVDLAGFQASTSEETSSAFTNPLVDSDYAPTLTSPAYKTGTKWWSGFRPVSSSGEPYPDIDIDKGGVQSTLGPFHPVNL